MNSLQTKLNLLRDGIRRNESAVVAFSGGVDSTFVLRVAHDVLRDRVIAVTALSESLPSGELEVTQKLADQIDVPHVVLRTFETQDKNYLANAANRCYFCKMEMYSRIKAFAYKEEIESVLDGLNQDDLSDRRPGRAAAMAQDVFSPLVASGLMKAEVRALSR